MERKADHLEAAAVEEVLPSHQAWEVEEVDARQSLAEAVVEAAVVLALRRYF